jgi:hypothetical protein
LMFDFESWRRQTSVAVVGAGGSNAPGYKLDIPGALTRGNAPPLSCCVA